MKRSFIEQLSFLLGSLITTPAKLFAIKKCYNDEFLEKFKTENDIQKLKTTVERLKKSGDNSPTKITLDSGKTITIVVNAGEFSSQVFLVPREFYVSQENQDIVHIHQYILSLRSLLVKIFDLKRY